MNADWSEMHELQGGNFIADTSEPIHDWLQKYIYPDDQAQVLATIAVAIQNKHLFELEHRVRQADGTSGWTYSRAVPLLDSAGEIIEWFGEANDISERKRIEQEREQILHREQTARAAAERANQEHQAQLQQASEFGAMLGRIIDKVRDSLYQVAGKAVRLDKMFEIVKNSTLWQESVEFCRILQQQKFKIKFVLPRTSEGSKNG